MACFYVFNPSFCRPHRARDLRSDFLVSTEEGLDSDFRALRDQTMLQRKWPNLGKEKLFRSRLYDVF